MRSPLILLALTLAGCSGMNRGGEWPTLAPRPGEIAPMVPRTPLGACPGCGQDVFAAPAAPVPPALLPPPADAAGRLAAIDKAIADVEAAYPAQRRATQAAMLAARGAAADSNAAVQAELERSRLESLFLPLAIPSKALDTLADDLAGRADTESLTARIAALRDRLARLETQRLAL